MQDYSSRFPRLFAFLSKWDNRLAPYTEPTLYALVAVELVGLALDLVFAEHPLSLTRKILLTLVTFAGSYALHLTASKEARTSLVDFFKKSKSYF
jgi:hypothetical protein